ncbi:MAG: hypothetical protein Q4Q53_07445 [Methanocorpusculum sp.]|nr:hypothetical protein [Methanocorpusculum sp.]
MGFLGDIERALGVWYKDPDDSPDDTNPQVALAFRKYVIDRLGDSFSVTERDLTVGEPDLSVVRKSDGEIFYLITCYRSQMFVGEDTEAYLPWTSEETYLKYFDFVKDTTCFVIIGLHGYADVPKFVFAVPLGEASVDLKKSTLAEFEKGKKDRLI